MRAPPTAFFAQTLHRTRSPRLSLVRLSTTNRQQLGQHQQVLRALRMAARRMRLHRCMRSLVESLYSAQQRLRSPSTTDAERQTLLENLRLQIPAPVLAHFLRLFSQGRKAVALVRHGVCSNCHLRVPSGVVAALAQPRDLHLCETCGSYLLLPSSEPSTPTARPTPVARRGRKPRAALAA